MEAGSLGGARNAVNVAAQQRADRVYSSAASRLSSAENLESLREAAADFEALFINYMLSTMRKAIPKSGLFPRSFARETYESMYDEELAKAMAKAGGMGLADMIVQQLGGAVYGVRSPKVPPGQ